MLPPAAYAPARSRPTATAHQSTASLFLHVPVCPPACAEPWAGKSALAAFAKNLYVFTRDVTSAPPCAGAFADLHSFDPASMAWTLLSPAAGSGQPPYARFGHGFASAGGKLYVHGGVHMDRASQGNDSGVASGREHVGQRMLA
jgi:hypothetical protein